MYGKAWPMWATVLCLTFSHRIIIRYLWRVQCGSAGSAGLLKRRPKFESRLGTPGRFRGSAHWAATAVKIWRRASANVYEWTMYCMNVSTVSRKINAKRVAYGHQTFIFWSDKSCGSKDYMFKSWFTMTSATGFSGSVLIKIWASGLYRPISSDGAWWRKVYQHLTACWNF